MSLGAAVEQLYVYRGHEDDRPLLWRPHLNELVGVLGELLNKRKKKLGASLEAAEHVGEEDDEPEGSTRRSSRRGAPGDKRNSRRGSRSAGRRSRLKGDDGDDDDYEDVGEDDDFEDLGDDLDDVPGVRGSGSNRGRGWTPEQREEFDKAKEACTEVEQELARVRRQISADDVLLRLRKQQSHDLKQSEHECEDSIEQARTWTKALQEVHEKRTKKLEDHLAKIDKSDAVLQECNDNIEVIQEEIRSEEGRHNWNQTTFTNGVKVENKTLSIWRDLEEDLRNVCKEVEGNAGVWQKELLMLTKRQQDLIIGGQEVSKRLSGQEEILKDVEREGEQLQQYWKREFRDAEMAVSSAKAEVEAEERARSHLVGHGDRIKSKLELTTGHLTAQTVIMEDQTAMDTALKAESEEVEGKIRQVQMEIDNQEEVKRTLEKQRDELQAQAQDKLEHLNASLRAIETSASAVATEQAIAQRTLQASEETLETIDVSDARNRLREDIDALRSSLTQIEARLHEVHIERAGVRESRARTQKEALLEGARINEKIEQVDVLVESLLGQRVRLEADQRETDGKRVVAHARVKQSRKAITPLEQERKLYLAELEWVREFEEHSFLRMQEKHELQMKLQKELEALRKEGGAQLKEQAEDESIIKDGIRALTELKEKINLHVDHVAGKVRDMKHQIALAEAEIASLTATLQALDGKQIEADDAIQELEEKRLAEQGEYEVADNERKGRFKDWSGKHKKETRINTSLHDGRKALELEVDEVITQLREQMYAAQSAAAQSTSLRGEREAVDKQIAWAQHRVDDNTRREDELDDKAAELRKEMHAIRKGRNKNRR